MATVRFTEVVKVGGKPEVYMTLTNPTRDKAFQKAKREMRVLSLQQKPTGTQKDYGMVGVLEGKHVTYLIFPRSLERFADHRVVGIKYEELDTAELAFPRVKIEVKAKSPKKRAAPVAKPRLKKFQITVRVVAEKEVENTVEARTREEAKAKAKTAPYDVDWKDAQVSRRIVKVREVK